MAVFQSSTQKEYWMFAPDQINEIRVKTNAEYVNRFNKSQEDDIHIENKLELTQNGNGTDANANDNGNYVNLKRARRRIIGDDDDDDDDKDDEERDEEDEEDEKKEALNQKGGSNDSNGKLDVDTMIPDHGSNPTASISTSQPLNAEDEGILRIFHEKRIVKICRKCKLPSKIIATAIMYFKRCFLNVSVMERNPTIIGLSCIYAALKVEEINLSAHELIMYVEQDRAVPAPAGSSGDENTAAGEEDPKKAANEADPFLDFDLFGHVKPEILLNTELEFLELLHFQLICFHPFNSLRALEIKFKDFVDTKTIVKHEGSDDDAEADIEKKRWRDIRTKLFRQAAALFESRIIYTNIMLQASPGSIAMALLYYVAQDLGCENEIKEFLAAVLASVSTNPVLVEPEVKVENGLITDDKENEPMETHHGMRSDPIKFASTTVSLDQIELLVQDIVSARFDKAFNIDLIKQLEARRKACSSKALDPLSDEYEDIQKAKQEKLEKKRLEKQLSRKEKMQRDLAELTGIPLLDIPKGHNAVQGRRQSHDSGVQDMDISVKKRKIN
eukprot:CAMPEP_0184703580 /NCGR_PEP_ID=MMETSP0313-20130426/28362_1 /TAXON_ID=2792 /ORGANISM="Porphyridium aerugineum, Strain SAG 1380-2" /LENGTH=557 /DNA_ID=CAMNT_0027164387 /DNA_START=93 /DNA_END=1766 /DNA_ORIENTATION=-